MFMSHSPRQGQELMFQPTETPETKTVLSASPDTAHAEITIPVLREAYDHPGPYIDIDQRKAGWEEIVRNLNEANRMNGFVTASETPPYSQKVQERYGRHLAPMQDNAISKHNRFLRNAQSRFVNMQQKDDLAEAGFDPQAIDNAIKRDWYELMAHYGPGASHANDRKKFIGGLVSRSSLAKADKQAAKRQVSISSR